jgi:hypothetical protein
MRRIRYAHKRNRKCWGMAYPDEYRIELDPDLDERTEIDIAIHEGLHVLFPDLPEVDVDTAGKTLADLLWRLGYRRKEDDDR